MLVDLAAATLRGRKALDGLGYLTSAGVEVTIRGEPAAIHKLRVPGRRAGARFILREVAPVRDCSVRAEITSLYGRCDVAS